jgi:hypothetical protein
MISLDWKQRLVSDSIDFFERKLPTRYYDFDIIYNAYPERVDNKVPRDVIVFVADTLATKMQKNHRDYLPFIEHIVQHKGENGKVAFAVIISKFMKKDYAFYFDYAKNVLFSINNSADITLIVEKVYFPIFKKAPLEHVDTLISWLLEGSELLTNYLLKVVLRICKTNPEFLQKFSDKLENRWLGASADFVKVNGAFLKSLGKLDPGHYLSIYKKYKTTREPVFVEILTAGLVIYDDFLLEAYEAWSKSGNARLKKVALTGYKFLKKKKPKL